MKSVNNQVSQFTETIFSKMSLLAHQQNAINLSQGYPDFDGPEFNFDIIKEVFQTRGPIHQYANSAGSNNLREKIHWTYQHMYQLDFDPLEEITVVNGATEGIFSSLLSLINPGDEVIVFEPYYDSYLATIKLAGGVPVPVTLHAPEFKWDPKELELAFSNKTKLVILNNPHNPSGRVFSKDELEELSRHIIQNDCFAFSDEVYEYLTYENYRHIPLASIKGMRERTMTTSSLGKTFGATGWKIGWVVAPASLTAALRKVHQFNTFCVNHPFQEVAAKMLERLPQYTNELKKIYTHKRELLLTGLEKAKLETITPQGTYFILCKVPEGHNDIQFCEELIKSKKVATIPCSAFFSKSTEGRQFVRFCFAKKEETLNSAISKLK